MRVSLRLFASLHDLVGQRELSLDLLEGATVSDLRQRFGETYPTVRPVLQTIAFAVDDEYVTMDQLLREGSEVALIPPVSGGADTDGLFRLTTDLLVADDLVALVRRDEAGAVSLFYGIVRDNSDGHPVQRLEYEAHESMALRQMREVGEETRRRFPISEIGVWHRVGTLVVGETSLLVAVSSPHRQEAFEACHWAVDRIKHVVPIWKKEYSADGASWVEGYAVEPASPASLDV